MLKKILLVVVALVVVVLGFVLSRPSTYHVERSVVVNAPPEVVFADINSLHDGFLKWSPWEKRDPAMKKTFNGPKDGVGSSYHWEGNKDVGKGTMTITESKPNEMVKCDLEFLEPFPSKSTITLSLAKDGDSTKATWAMDGAGGFSTKVMNAFSSMDKMIGPDFEQGLKNLQKVAADEAAAKKAAEEAAAKAAAEAAPPPPAPPVDAEAPAAKG